MTRTILKGLAMVVVLAAPTSIALAQRETDSGVEIDKDIALLRRNLRTEKKKLIAANLPLTETEATKFWPIYDQYSTELRKIKDKQYATFQDYADHFGTLTDEKAASLMKDWLDVDVAVTQLRAKYLPIVSKAIGGKKGATWAQLDRRIQMMVDLQLSSKTPLVQAQSK